jgi:presenilin-like A22 family membrane protease
MLAAPRARRRLPLRLRAPFELAVFALAALALWQAAAAIWGASFAVIAAANAVLLTAFDQWEA